MRPIEPINGSAQSFGTGDAAPAPAGNAAVTIVPTPEDAIASSPCRRAARSCMTATPKPVGRRGGIETATVIGDATVPLTWALVSGDLPDGVSLAPNGELNGTLPDGSAGTYDVTLEVTDADGLTATSDQTITIAPGCASPSPTPSPTASTAPIGGGQPAAVPTAVAAGVPTTAGPDRRQPTTGADLTLLASGAALLAAAAALTVIGGLRRRARRQ